MSVEEKETIMAYETVTLQTLLREIAGRTSSNQDADAIRMAADALDAFAADVRRDEAIRAAEDAAAVPAIQHRDLPEIVAELRERVARLEAVTTSRLKPTTGSESVTPTDGLRTEMVTLEVTHHYAEPLASWLLGALDSVLNGPGENVFVMDSSHEIARLTAERDAAKEECERLRVAHLKAALERDRANEARGRIRSEWTRRGQSLHAAQQTIGALNARVAELEAAPPPRGWLTAEERAAVEEAMVDYASNVGDHDCERIERVLRALLARSTPPRVKVPSELMLCEARGVRIVYDAGKVKRAIRAAGGEVEE